MSRKANSLPIFQGIYIADLKEKSTLKAAGMKINDIIIQINDEPMYDVDELGLKIEAMPKTTTMSITFLRLQASGDFSTQTVTAANIIDGATFYEI